MSKALLKKELAHLDHDQLVEVILNAYSSSKETKDYFEFFLNPDADTLLDKKIEIIAKELTRSKHGYSKARISVIRKTIKSFSSYGIGDEYTYKLLYNTIRMIVGMEQHYYYPNALNNGVLLLTTDFVILADKMECMDDAMAKLERLNSENIGRQLFRSKVLSAAQETIKELSNKKIRYT